MKTGGKECAQRRRNRRSAIPALLPGAPWDGQEHSAWPCGDLQLVLPQKGDVNPPSSPLTCNSWGNEAEQDFFLPSGLEVESERGFSSWEGFDVAGSI